MVEYLANVHLFEGIFEEGLLGRAIVADAEGSFDQAHQGVESFLSERPVAEVQYLLVDEVEAPLQASDEFGLDEHQQHVHASAPLRRPPDLLVEVALLVLVVAPELAAHHVQLVGLEEEFVGEGQEGALAPEGEKVLGVGSVQQLIVQVFLVRQRHAQPPHPAVLQELVAA